MLGTFNHFWPSYSKKTKFENCKIFLFFLNEHLGIWKLIVHPHVGYPRNHNGEGVTWVPINQFYIKMPRITIPHITIPCASPSPDLISPSYLNPPPIWITLYLHTPIFRSPLYLDPLPIWIPLISGSHSYLDPPHIWIPLISGSPSYIDPPHIWILLPFGPSSYQGSLLLVPHH